jgi:RNA methyltransferase, TrmH family
MKKSFGQRPSKSFGGRQFNQSKPKRRGERIIGMKYKSDDASVLVEKSMHRPKPVSAAFAKKTSAARLVQSLQDKKTRTKTNLFLVEGETSVIEALESAHVPSSLFVSHEFLGRYPEIKSEFPHAIHIVDEAELSSLGTLAMNKSVIGVFKQKELPKLSVGNEIIIALAGVNDPGNLGTIIRIADWYGVKKIVASFETVDVYNPKTISATKGSFTRVDVYYSDLEEFFTANKAIPVFAADMHGENIHETKFPFPGILLLGNETHGVPSSLSKLISKRITIPRIGGAESLNVGVSGAVILDNWLRR